MCSPLSSTSVTFQFKNFMVITVLWNVMSSSLYIGTTDSGEIAKADISLYGVTHLKILRYTSRIQKTLTYMIHQSH
jgi:hypothetical protein